MSTKLGSAGGFFALCLGVFPSCMWLSGKRAPVYNVEHVRLDQHGTVEQVGERIRRAARIQGWEIEEVEPQVLYVTKRLRQHSATAALSYDSDSFSIKLRGSEYLKQSDDRIHKLYNEWVHDLERTIEREVTSGGGTLRSTEGHSR